MSTGETNDKPEPVNPSLLAFAENFAMPPVPRASIRHKMGIKRSCFFPVYAPYVRMLKLHNHYLKPNEFGGAHEEYRHIRNTAGLMDVTGEEVISVEGPDALALMNSLVPRDLDKLPDGKAIYCVMCYDHGGIVEDAILVRFDAEKLWWVGGPGYSEQWIYVHSLNLNVEVRGHNDDLHVASLQGPRSREILSTASDIDVESLPVFGVGKGKICGVTATVTRTGYTAELGYDIYVDVRTGEQLFRGLCRAVQESGGGLCGSAALNLRRMEAGILNFTEDFDWQHTPFDIGLGWMVDFDKPANFTGREALARRAASRPEKKLAGMLLDKAVPLTAGIALDVDAEQVGEITSAVLSPTLERKIALGWVDSAYASPGTELKARVDATGAPVQVVKRPFLDAERKLMRA